MTQAEMENFHEQLIHLSKRIKGEFSDLQSEALRGVGGTASGNLSDVPVHLADLGTDAFEQEVSLSLLANEQQILEEISAALDRMEQGTYGRCENCGQEIGKERLRAVPYTRLCINCASQNPPPSPTGGK
jgi:RNA polymerase-binding protein DksA